METTPYTDEELLADIRAGGQKRLEAIRIIYEDRGLKSQVIRFVEKNNGNRQDGEDIFHEGIILLDRKIRLEDFDPNTRLRGYVYSTCRFLWMNQVRKNAKTNLLADHSSMDKVDYDDPGTFVFQEEQRQLVDELLSQIGERCKKVLSLWKRSYSMDEIAQEMNFSGAALAKKTKYRCYKKLIELLQQNPNLLNQLKAFYEK